jgi:hypothetical protein
MKRHINLVKDILSFLEDSDSIVTEIMLENYSPFPTYTDYLVTYHVFLLHEAGYITGGVFMDDYDCNMNFATLQLTWQGHEFLAVLKDKEIINRIISLNKKGFANMSFDVIKDVAKKLIETKAEKLLGIG